MRGLGDLPLVGDLLSFIDDRLAFAEACRDEGDAVRVRLGPKRALVISHPELVRELILREAQHFERGLSGAALRGVLGEGLLLSEGKRWQRQRREIQPHFASDRADGWVHATAGATDALVARWRDGERRDIHVEMRRLTLDVAARVLLGVASDERGGLHPALEMVLADDVFRAPTDLPVLRKVLGPRRRAPLVALDRLLASGDRGPHANGIAAALRARGVDDREVRDQLVTLLFTAQDTTSVALTWTWHLLANDERVASIVRGAPTRVYVDAIVDEAMRLFPPVIGEARECVRACEIGGHSVTPGTMVMFSQWVLHRDPRWFDRPLAFEPERWLDGLRRSHPFAYIPFGAGRRNCVGRPLAEAILATAVPRIAAEWRFEPAGAPPAIQALITPKPKGGLPMTLRRLS